MASYSYVGEELDLFARATNWKSYYRSHLAPYLKGDVLEVGAGIGGTTVVLCDGTQRSWTCLEPDPTLLERIDRLASEGALPMRPELRVGTLADLDPGARFDAIIYIDVLEHIEDDRSELARACERLRPGGHVVVLCPAHNFLFSPFDTALGHFRRYNRKMYKAITPPGLVLERAFYLDSCGMMLSLGNRLLARQSTPKPSQIALWDRWFVKVSRVTDPILAHSMGKTVIGIWQRPIQ